MLSTATSSSGTKRAFQPRQPATGTSTQRGFNVPISSSSATQVRPQSARSVPRNAVPMTFGAARPQGGDTVLGAASSAATTTPSSSFGLSITNGGDQQNSSSRQHTQQRPQSARAAGGSSTPRNTAQQNHASNQGTSRRTSLHPYNGSMFHGGKHSALCKGRPKIPSAIATLQQQQQSSNYSGTSTTKTAEVEEVEEGAADFIRADDSALLSDDDNKNEQVEEPPRGRRATLPPPPQQQNQNQYPQQVAVPDPQTENPRPVVSSSPRYQSTKKEENAEGHQHMNSLTRRMYYSRAFHTQASIAKSYRQRSGVQQEAPRPKPPPAVDVLELQVTEKQMQLQLRRAMERRFKGPVKQNRVRRGGGFGEGEVDPYQQQQQHRLAKTSSLPTYSTTRPRRSNNQEGNTATHRGNAGVSPRNSSRPWSGRSAGGGSTMMRPFFQDYKHHQHQQQQRSLSPREMTHQYQYDLNQGEYDLGRDEDPTSPNKKEEMKQSGLESSSWWLTQRAFLSSNTTPVTTAPPPGFFLLTATTTTVDQEKETPLDFAPAGKTATKPPRVPSSSSQSTSSPAVGHTPAAQATSTPPCSSQILTYNPAYHCWVVSSCAVSGVRSSAPPPAASSTSAASYPPYLRPHYEPMGTFNRLWCEDGSTIMTPGDKPPTARSGGDPLASAPSKPVLSVQGHRTEVVSGEEETNQRERTAGAQQQPSWVQTNQSGLWVEHCPNALRHLGLSAHPFWDRATVLDDVAAFSVAIELGRAFNSFSKVHRVNLAISESVHLLDAPVYLPLETFAPFNSHVRPPARGSTSGGDRGGLNATQSAADRGAAFSYRPHSSLAPVAGGNSGRSSVNDMQQTAAAQATGGYEPVYPPPPPIRQPSTPTTNDASNTSDGVADNDVHSECGQQQKNQQQPGNGVDFRYYPLTETMEPPMTWGPNFSSLEGSTLAHWRVDVPALFTASDMLRYRNKQNTDHEGVHSQDLFTAFEHFSWEYTGHRLMCEVMSSVGPKPMTVHVHTNSVSSNPMDGVPTTGYEEEKVAECAEEDHQEEDAARPFGKFNGGRKALRRIEKEHQCSVTCKLLGLPPLVVF